MGKHDGSGDDDFKAHPAIEEALRQKGFEQELHWVLRAHVSDAPPIDGGAGSHAGAQKGQPHVDRHGQTEHDQKGDGAAPTGQTSGKQQASGAENASHDGATSQSKHKGDKGPESDAARKTKQRAQAESKGWKEVTVMAPKDKDARRLVAEFARVIFDSETRAILRLAVASPKLVVLGQKAERLSGLRRILVHWLLG